MSLLDLGPETDAQRGPRRALNWVEHEQHTLFERAVNYFLQAGFRRLYEQELFLVFQMVLAKLSAGVAGSDPIEVLSPGSRRLD